MTSLLLRVWKALYLYLLLCCCRLAAFSPPTYICPQHVHRSANDNHENFEPYERSREKHSKEHFTSNQYKFDGWGVTQSERREMLLDLKRDWYCPAVPLENGLIYESAVGLGYNLRLTGDVLEECGRRGFRLFGNDYLRHSVDIGRRIVGQMGPPAPINGNTKPSPQLGVLCRADAANLSFVPASTFDLAFTGYIDPLQDPLNIGWDRYDEICNSTVPSDVLLVDTAQAMQNKWVTSWVHELLRIVKPGGTVIIESMAWPYCEWSDDWGGVKTSWWADAAVDWDVEPGSVETRTAFDQRMAYGSS